MQVTGCNLKIYKLRPLLITSNQAST